MGEDVGGGGLPQAFTSETGSGQRRLIAAVHNHQLCMLECAKFI